MATVDAQLPVDINNNNGTNNNSETTEQTTTQENQKKWGGQTNKVILSDAQVQVESGNGGQLGKFLSYSVRAEMFFKKSW